MSKSSKRSFRSQQNTQESSLRIIGGEWRSRLINFAPQQGLRPTPNRIRETLFNWLAPVIEGATCLDLFAGSGALSFEALSRGAQEAIIVDLSKPVCVTIQLQLDKLNCKKASIYQDSAQQWLITCMNKMQIDIVFLDPPFDQDLLYPVVKSLHEGNFLKPGAYIYIESEFKVVSKEMPENWQLVKQKRSGEVYYHLYQARY